MRVSSLFRTHTDEALALGFGALAVVLYLCCSWGWPAGRFNSPDEAANAYFGTRVSQGLSMAAPSAYESVAGLPAVQPRSTVVVKRALVPASFVGWPLLLGTMGRVFGQGALPLVTPLAALFGVACFYFIGRELFSRRAAIISTGLFIALPAYWYYESRVFFHNAIFFDFLLLAAWAAVRWVRTRQVLYAPVAGVAYGLAMAMRTSEIFWVTIAGIVWLSFYSHRLSLRSLWLLVAGALAGFAPVLVMNTLVYGQPIAVGYDTGLAQATASLTSATSLLQQLILPFGFHPRVMLSTAWSYLAYISWWWLVLTALGLAGLLMNWRRLSQDAKNWCKIGFFISLCLLVLYGSWQFHDNPDPTAVTLGTSYVRYWLPLYTWWLWPAGWILSEWWEKRWSRVVVLVLVFGYVVLSANLVLAQPSEGLWRVKQNVVRFQTVNQAVVRLTPPGSVIVTDITDKLFWPERDVMVRTNTNQDYVAVQKLLETHVPVYLFHATWKPVDVAYLNTRVLPTYRLHLTPVQYGFEDFSLYRFDLTKL